jgi:beta-galactosidase
MANVAGMKSSFKTLCFFGIFGGMACALLSSAPASRAAAPAVARTTRSFDAGWRFSLGDYAEAMSAPFDDSAWQTVNVPHDWSSDGPFGPEYGSGNGFAPGGIGWYRKHFTLGAAAQGKKVTIEFDGVYDNSEVWINGQFVGRRPYGYSAFVYDLTPFLSFSGENVIAVRVDHSRFADSRWYTGSGIYRHVRLQITSPLHIATWGTVVTTPAISATSAQVHIETTVVNDGPKSASYSVESSVQDASGHEVASQTSGGTLAMGDSGPTVQNVRVMRPVLWSLAAPTLYTLHSRVTLGGVLQDDTVTPFGIRTLKYDPNLGFLLNGVPTKLKGVCIHHDAGSLGAAVPDGVLERRLRLLQEMGVNAIRTSHNPPAPELLNMCDRMGFLVMEEAFDEWTPSKNKWVQGRNSGQPSKFGYAEFFQEWSVRDIQDMVRRDRNHPSVIMWSIGNEIDYPNDPFSHPVLGNNYRPLNPSAANLPILARPLIAAIKELDMTRPVTAALAAVNMSDAVGLGEMLDIDGYNYQEYRYPADHKKYPKRFLYGSETSTSYDAWVTVRDNPYVGGQFLWTGIDYLGESDGWPQRASGAGLLDLCGFEKPLGWFRQSLWSDTPMVYLCVAPAVPAGGGAPGGFRRRPQESWNWPAGAALSVSCYTNCPEVRLTLNGTVVGTKTEADKVNGTLTWSLPYAPGTVQAEGLRGGKVVAIFALHTAGAPSRLLLLPDTTSLRAGSQDICHIEFRVVDAQGVRVPDAVLPLTFTLTGPATLLGLGSGNLSDPQPGRGLTHSTYQGRGLAILQAASATGPIIFTAAAPGLPTATLTLAGKE